MIDRGNGRKQLKRKCRWWVVVMGKAWDGQREAVRLGTRPRRGLGYGSSS